MKTTISILKPELNVTKEQYVVSLLCKGPRQNGHKGLVGLLVIEGIDQNENYFMNAIGRDFSLNSPYETYTIPARLSDDKNTILEMLGYSKKSILNLVRPMHFKSQQVEEDSWAISSSKLTKYFSGSPLYHDEAPKNLLEAETLGAKDFSFNKAIAMLRALERPLKNLELEEPKQLRKLELSPFKFLIETSNFSAARLRRSNLWRRFKDTFKVLHGDVGVWDKNELGVLDYLFIFPRPLWIFAIFLTRSASSKPKLFTFLLNVAAVSVAIPAVLLMGVKFLAATLLTAALTLVIAPFHLIMLPFAKEHTQKINLMRVRKIKTDDGDLDCIDDLREQQDLREEKYLGEAFNTAEMKKMLIKPLSKNDQLQYSLKPKLFTENTIASTNKAYDVKYLGLYEIKSSSNRLEEGAPRAVIEVKPDNYDSLYSAMKMNMFKINNNLEKVATMPLEMYSTVFAKKK